MELDCDETGGAAFFFVVIDNFAHENTVDLVAEAISHGEITVERIPGKLRVEIDHVSSAIGDGGQFPIRPILEPFRKRLHGRRPCGGGKGFSMLSEGLELMRPRSEFSSRRPDFGYLPMQNRCSSPRRNHFPSVMTGEAQRGSLSSILATC